MASKITFNDLAIMGGNPSFNELIHVGRPNVGEKEKILERISTIIDNRWFTNNGPFVQEFEDRIQRFLGVKHCIAICNATIALEIIIRALDLKGEVIIPSYTFVATAHSLKWLEITPVFCDIDPISHTIDVNKIEHLITPKTTGIIGVHTWGTPCNIEELEKLATGKKLKLIFDAAHAFGCSYRGKMIGNFGEAEVVSFHATKFFNSFEGGAILTNDSLIADRVKLMRNFGFAGFDNVISLGTNGKMTEVSAAMGITSLESIDKFIYTNKKNYKIYKDSLCEVKGITVYPQNEEEKRNFQYIVIEIDEDKTKLSRDTLIKILHAENVMARKYFFPGCHRMEPYRSLFRDAALLLPETERIAKRVIVLPTGTGVDTEKINGICAILKLSVSNAEEIKLKMGNIN
jgi:dTDP-4-amino-4,6-dideoxygalactose transaminase